MSPKGIDVEQTEQEIRRLHRAVRAERIRVTTGKILPPDEAPLCS